MKIRTRKNWFANPASIRSSKRIRRSRPEMDRQPAVAGARTLRLLDGREVCVLPLTGIDQESLNLIAKATLGSRLMLDVQTGEASAVLCISVDDPRIVFPIARLLSPEERSALRLVRTDGRLDGISEDFAEAVTIALEVLARAAEADEEQAERNGLN